MSSHREAPEISKDPVADSTDLYAFVSPDRPDTVTFLANYIPLQDPAGGPNFFEFGDDVCYRINISTSGRGAADIVYEFRFSTRVRDRDTFLYNTGRITSLSSPTFNRRQFYSVRKYTRRGSEMIGQDLASPPCNIGPSSTPHYQDLAAAAVHDLGRDAGCSPGSGPTASTSTSGRSSTCSTCVRSRTCTSSRCPRPRCQHARAPECAHDRAAGPDPRARGLEDADRPDGRAREHRGVDHGQPALLPGLGSEPLGQHGSYRQVSRLGMPLINEVVIPMGRKDEWNRREPKHDR